MGHDQYYNGTRAASTCQGGRPWCPAAPPACARHQRESRDTRLTRQTASENRERRQLASEDGRELRRLHVPRAATCPRCAASSRMHLVVVYDGTDAREPQRRRTRRLAGVLGRLRSSRALDCSCAMSACRSACRGGERHELPTRSHVVRSLCARARPRRRCTVRRTHSSPNALCRHRMAEIFAWTIRSQTGVRANRNHTASGSCCVRRRR